MHLFAAIRVNIFTPTISLSFQLGQESRILIKCLLPLGMNRTIYLCKILSHFANKYIYLGRSVSSFN